MITSLKSGKLATHKSYAITIEAWDNKWRVKLVVTFL